MVAVARGRVNLYMVYSPLHYISAEQIAQHFEADARNCLFFIKNEFRDMVRTSACDTVKPLPWPRFNPLPGPFGRVRRTIDNLRIVGDHCEGAEEIVIHTPVIDTEAVNYCINYLRGRFSDARVAVRLLPDGVLNLQLHRLGRLKELLQYVRKLRRVFFRELDFYTFRGDRTGSQSDIVDRIYLLPGFPHQYPPEKVVEMPNFCSLDIGPSRSERSALIVGQPLVTDRRLTREQAAAVAQGLTNLLHKAGVTSIFYKAHPREKGRELPFDGDSLSIDEPLESYLVKNPYDIVAGSYSTALLTARLILPPECRVISYGFDLIDYRQEDMKNKVEEAFLHLGVEMVPHCDR